MCTVSSSPVATCLLLTRGLSRATSPEDVYAAALDVLAQAVGVSRAAVLLFDGDGVMRFKAWRGLSAVYRKAVEGHSPWQADTPDPQPIVVGDVARDRSLEPYHPTFTAEGIAALAFIPLVSVGRVIGKFMLYYDRPYTLSGEERQLVEMIAAQVAFALERTRAEESSQISEERMRFALDAAAMGTWQLDLRTRLVTWSANVERIHGYEPGVFYHTFDVYEQLIHHDDRDRVVTSIHQAIEGGKPYDIEYRVIGADGAVRWVESKGRVEYENGHAVRMTGICMSVTGRKEAEFARLADAHEANLLKDQFLATLSHELRSPLNAIIGWIHVLEQDAELPERLCHAIDIVKRNANLQAQLIEDILDVSRIITGKLTIEPQTLDIASLVETTLGGLLPAAAVKQIQLTLEMPDDLPIVQGDPKRLQQILGNVISNAIKFTPDRGEVHVCCGVSEDRLLIEVRDSGGGIAPELLPHIFDRFRQGDNGSTRQHGGLGLGLAIARHLVELHGGDIHATSDGAGHGTTVHINLPLAAAGEPVARSHVAPSEATPDLSGFKVLVVDDLEDSRELLVRLLHQWGATVLQCPSAHTALAALSSTTFHLLVADIAMPDLDGYDLIERVRRVDGVRGRVPAIAVTAYARREDRDRALAAGFNAYCPKPLDTSEFARIVAELFTAGTQTYADVMGS
jgi:PAS domain S-box-containing protein